MISGGYVLDPEHETASSLAGYDHREWRIFRVLTLEDAVATAA